MVDSRDGAGVCEGEGVVNGAGGGEEQSMHLHPEASVGALPMQGFAREQDWESSQGLGLGVWGLGFGV